MYSKLLIKANIKVLTGMHIGGSNAFSAIGAIDSTVIRDAVTKLPIIPGSSIKGKMRTLLARSIKNTRDLNDANDDDIEIRRLFGSSKKGDIKKSRLQFSDAFLNNKDELGDASPTEIKFENTINRMNSIANPRQIERVVRGASFSFSLTYDADMESEIQKDFENLQKAFKLLQMDYIGGHGTRGYGRVGFENFEIKLIEGDIKEDRIKELCKMLKEVESYAILSL